jgi:parallel beta-helix repeat protein
MRDAIVISAPLLVIVLYLIVASTVDYHRSRQFDDYYANSISIERRFKTRLGQLLRMPRAIMARQRLSPEANDAGIINLLVDPQALDAMYDAPQLGWGVWTEGTLDQHGNLLPVNIRKRGDNSIHWLTDKHTLTVRTRRTDFYKQYRAFGLSTKTVLTSYVANRLAGDFELLAPATTVVPVFINNQYSGMFRFLEVVDESFLRPLNRMPGNIFRGDAAERSDYFKGLPRDLFANPYIWNRVAANDRPTAAGTGQLRLFIEDINSGGFDAHQRLMRRVDRDEISRLVAYLLLMGDPYHMDATHNQLWYEDPSTSLLHPIPWDTRLLRLAARPPQRVSAFLRAALRDPWLVDAIMTRVAREVQGGNLVARADSLARTMWNRYHDGFVYDSLRPGMVPDLGYPSEVHRVLTQNVQTLDQWVRDARVVFATGASPGGGRVIDLETRGYASLELLGVASRGGVIAGLRLDRNRNGVLDPEDPAAPGRWDQASGRFLLDNALPILAAWRTDQPGITRGAQHYRFFAVGSGSAGVEPVLKNRFTGEPVNAGTWEPGAAISAPTSFNPWQYPEVRGRSHRFRGSVHLAEDLRIPRQDTLIIESGTTIRLDPDVSIISRGLVLAEGTQARPIIFTRSDSILPWGAFSLLGKGADSSVFRYVTWQWGGGDLVDRIEYIGMVNLHRVSGVLVEHASFKDNLRSDDTFHALHSDFILRSSEFIRANSDAADIDVSTGLLENNTFYESGGDGIDLMASTPMIRGNRIYRSKDKGISVGEASNPVLFNNYIEGCERGIEVKDRSDPVALNNTLVGNGVGIYSDRKNWRYGGGGFGTFINNTLRENRTPLELDMYSRITLANTTGLDSTAMYVSSWGSTVAQNDLEGLYLRYGIDLGGRAAATIAQARWVSPVPPLATARFEEDFESVDDGWRRSGGVGRVEKMNRTLHATAEVHAGAIGRDIDLDLRQSGPATLALEATAADMDSARVTLVSADGNVSALLPLSGNPTVFNLFTLALPARKYTAIVITMSPRPRIEKLVRNPGWTELKPGQFWLRGYDVYPSAPGPATLGPPGS